MPRTSEKEMVPALTSCSTIQIRWITLLKRANELPSGRIVLIKLMLNCFGS